MDGFPPSNIIFFATSNTKRKEYYLISLSTDWLTGWWWLHERRRFQGLIREIFAVASSRKNPSACLHVEYVTWTAKTKTKFY